MTRSSAVTFGRWCRDNSVLTEEGSRNLVKLRTLTSPRSVHGTAWVSPEAVRALNAETLATVYDIGPAQAPKLLRHARAVEIAHALWTGAAPAPETAP